MSSIYIGVAGDDVGVVNADISDVEDTRFGEDKVGTESSI